jgi:hypothetical protein
LPLYYDAILRGLVDESREAITGGPDGKAEAEVPNDEPLSTELLLKVVERVHRLPNKPCGPAICRVADALAERSVPVELVEIVAHYALNAPDPVSEVWNEDAGNGQKYYGGDPLSAGINSARGRAADSLAHFLFAHPELADRLLPYVEALARDKSLAVRAVTIHALLALLNTHRDRAVELFIETSREAGALWVINPVEEFIHHATYTHYTAVRPLLRRMLESTADEARHAAACQITLAAFRHEEARADLNEVLGGDAECRRAAAEIYAGNVHYESVREDCIPHLKRFFDDQSERVREVACNWFRGRHEEWTDWHRDLLASFINSAAFVNGGSDCMVNLADTPAALPQEFLDLACRAVGLCEANIEQNPPYGMEISYRLPALVIRFYEQARDEAPKKVCLDLLDRMLALGWGEAASELSSVDR